MKAFKTLMLLLALGLSAYGQAVNVTANKLKGSATAPSGSCPAQQVQLTTAGVIWTCASGTWSSAGGGGTTINSTNGQLPYRVNSTTFGDSAFASNALNSTYLSATSGASGAGLTLTVAGGGTNENLILTPKGSGVIEQRNSTNAQTFQIYNTYTDASNYERLKLSWESNVARVGVEVSGSGSTVRGLLVQAGQGLYLDGGSNGPINFRQFGTDRWSIGATTGHFLAATDNTYDIGASGATRPRNYYGGGNIVIAGGVTSSNSVIAGAGYVLGWSGRGGIYSVADSTIVLTNNANTDFSRLQFGGTSASFPAIKRSGAGIDIRLADDSAYANLTALNIVAAGGGRLEAYGYVSAGSGSDYRWAGKSSMFSDVDGNIRLTNATATDFGRLQFGGITSSFPSLKRSSAELQVRLADDSAYAAIAASINNLDKIITAGGTTGDQTINKSSFTVNFAAAATAITVTNSFVTANSNIICTAQTNDTTLKSVAAAPGSGSVVLTANAAATAETRVGCVIHN